MAARGPAVRCEAKTNLLTAPYPSVERKVTNGIVPDGLGGAHGRRVGNPGLLGEVHSDPAFDSARGYL